MEEHRTRSWAIVVAVLCAVLAPFAFVVLPFLVVIGGVPLAVGMNALSNGERRTGLALGALGVLVVLPGIAGLVLLKPYRIPSESMAATVQVGDRVLVTRFGGNDPEVGDIVVLHPPAAATGDQEGVGPDEMCGAPQPRGAACATPVSRDSSQSFIKRVVARGGDRVAIVRGKLVRNGRVVVEPYVQANCDAGLAGDFPTPITIPRGTVYVLGDNRECSEDSRYWGAVRTSAIVGSAVFRSRPFSRLGGL